jgi:hypothetical protein
MKGEATVADAPDGNGDVPESGLPPLPPLPRPPVKPARSTAAATGPPRRLFRGWFARRIWVHDDVERLIALDDAVEWLMRNDSCYRQIGPEMVGMLLQAGCWLRTPCAWFCIHQSPGKDERTCKGV